MLFQAISRPISRIITIDLDDDFLIKILILFFIKHYILKPELSYAMFLVYIRVANNFKCIDDFLRTYVCSSSSSSVI